jgi:N-acetylmuramoyl-L-alanine amidase
MRWSKKRASILTAFVLISCVLLLSVADPAKQFTIYTLQTTYSIEVTERQGQMYIGLMDLLGPLGATITPSQGNNWTVQLNKAEARFTEGKDAAKIRGSTIDLGGGVLAENNRVLVPLSASFSILSSLLHKNVDFHPAGRRIFVENAGVRFTSELKKAERSSLVLSFSQPVNPSIHQEGNKSQLVFKREPLISDLVNQPFDDKAIRSLNFSEENGMAALTITGDTALNVSVGGDGRTILVQTLPTPAPTTADLNKQVPVVQPSPETSVTPQSPQPAEMPAQNQGHSSPVYFVMIDPSHGGSDRGAFLSDKLDEKDLTLAMARKLKAELQDRGIAARLLRDSDVNLSLEQRAELTNAQHAGMYIAIHAGVPGQEVRVYTPALTSSSLASSSSFSPGVQSTTKPGQFLPWETAQSAFLNQSQTVALAVTGELQKKDVRSISLTAPMRPLNNIVAPAIAVELSADRLNSQDLLNPRVQSQVAASVATGIAHARAQIEAAK